MARVLVNSTAASAALPGEIKAYVGGSVPFGYFICDGRSLLVADYPALHGAIGFSHGGNGTTTFNVPDYRGKFLRGKVDISTVSGTGSVALNNATFTSHGVNRTGFKVRLAAGTLTGLAASTYYYAIVVNSDTLAFATSLSNAIAGTKIAISGVNSAVITQYEDPDADIRSAGTVGGSSGNSLGSIQDDTLQNITGTFGITDDNATNYRWRIGQATGAFTGYHTTTAALSGSGGGVASGVATDISFSASNSQGARTSSETRPSNSLINYIIKY